MVINLLFQSCERCPGKSSHISPWVRMVEHPRYALNREKSEEIQSYDLKKNIFYTVNKFINTLPVLSMEFERRYDPSELKLSPVTESPWPCIL